MIFELFLSTKSIIFLKLLLNESYSQVKYLLVNYPLVPIILVLEIKRKIQIFVAVLLHHEERHRKWGGTCIQGAPSHVKMAAM